MGVAGSLRATIEDDNLLFGFALQAFELCRRQGVSVWLAHPSSSWAWYLFDCRAAALGDGVGFFDSDSCRWGAPWKRSISLMTNIPALRGRGVYCNCTIPHMRVRSGQKGANLTTQRDYFHSFNQNINNHDLHHHSVAILAQDRLSALALAACPLPWGLASVLAVSSEQRWLAGRFRLDIELAARRAASDARRQEFAFAWARHAGESARAEDTGSGASSAGRGSAADGEAGRC